MRSRKVKLNSNKSYEHTVWSIRIVKKLHKTAASAAEKKTSLDYFNLGFNLTCIFFLHNFAGLSATRDCWSNPDKGSSSAALPVLQTCTNTMSFNDLHLHLASIHSSH